MLFSSISFIFIFLPLVLLAYYISASLKAKNAVLLVSSIVFYGWGEPRYLAVMLSSMILTWIGGMWISRTKWKIFVLSSFILVNLGVLVYFKYANFILDNVNAIFHSDFDVIKIVMPIGISFYTFQAISYLVDVYRGQVVVQYNLYKVMLYISLFPQLIAGPIVKYHDVCNQISYRNHSIGQFYYGIRRFIIGLSKKMLIANTMGSVADTIFSTSVCELGCLTAWLGALAYALQIYYDFSGYSDMAIGLCCMFGIKLPENFNYPYISSSITEFWRRWHISLSTWFKEYLYIPLGGNRVSKQRNIINLTVVFLATGIWHGASWCFVIWGMWHGIFIVLEKLTGWHKIEGGIFVKLVKHVLTLVVVLIGWVFFRADNMYHASMYIKRMFDVTCLSDFLLSYQLNRFNVLIFLIGIFFAVPVAKDILNSNNKSVVYITDFWIIILFVVSAAAIASATYNPFIYFRF